MSLLAPLVGAVLQFILAGFVIFTGITEINSPLKNVLAIILLLGATSIVESVDVKSAIIHFNSLTSGILLPLLLDEVHGMLDPAYYKSRDNSQINNVPFFVLVALLVSSFFKPSNKQASTNKIVIAVATVASCTYKMDLQAINIYTYVYSLEGALQLTHFCKSVAIALSLRERWCLSLFESSLLMTFSGYAVHYVHILRGMMMAPVSNSSSNSGSDSDSNDPYAPLNSMWLFIIATMVMVDSGALMTMGSRIRIEAAQSFKPKRRGKDTDTDRDRDRDRDRELILLTIAFAALFLDMGLWFAMMPSSIPQAIRWLLDFLHADDMLYIKVSGVWSAIILVVLCLADYVTSPKLTILEVPQEHSPPSTTLGEAVMQTTVLKEVTYVDFDKPRWGKISSRKLFHFLMVVILAPILTGMMPLHPCPSRSRSLSFCALAVGGVLVIFILLEALRSIGYLYPIKERPVWLLSMTCYFDRFTGQKKRWGNEITIMGRAYNPAIDEVQRLSMASRKTWSLTKDHMSLLLGCGIPLWYYCSFTNAITTAYNPGSGVLALLGCVCVGLGDALGAVFGSNYGRIKWMKNNPDNKRTIEGSLAALIGSLLMVAAIAYVTEDARDRQMAIFLPAAISVSLATLLEAFAIDNDNLLLALYPTVAYGALLIHFTRSL